MLEESFAELKREFSRFDFRLEYTVATRDGRIVENTNLAPEIEAWIRKACHFYLESSEEVRSAIRNLFDDDHKLWHLFMFTKRLQDKISGSADMDLLILGLTALSIEDCRYDPRDTGLVTRSLLRKAARAGLKVDRALKDIAYASTGTMRTMFNGLSGIK